jgi:hypothetical protein
MEQPPDFLLWTNGTFWRMGGIIVHPRNGVKIPETDWKPRAGLFVGLFLFIEGFQTPSLTFYFDYGMRRFGFFLDYLRMDCCQQVLEFSL